MRIELISTGDELLSGDITDTNASWLAQQLTEHGFKLSYKTTVSDDLDELVDAFTQRSARADFIIVNGGLGPTSDDLSADAAALALDEPMMLFKEWLEQMKIKFAAFGRPMTDNNLKQAILPQSAQIVDNPVGTACGFKITLNNAMLLFTPGVPREFKVMVKEQILPLLVDLNDEPPLVIERFLCMGIGESALAYLVGDLELPAGCELGYRAAMPFIELKIFAKQQQSLAPLVKQVSEIVSKYCVVRQGNSLSKHVHQLLMEKSTLESSSFKFGTVESCTGGLIASSLVAYDGSSSYMDRGLVTYSNDAKKQLVGVSEQTLGTAGAVSVETAEQMAKGAVTQHQLDLAISVTGIAGPQGGSVGKPVGTVAFALADKTHCYSQMLCLGDRGRANTQQLAMAIALDMVRRYLGQLDVIADYDAYKPF
jgi:nicotinamide-nucleotide amidase